MMSPDVVNGISVRLSDFNRDREVAAEIKKTGYKAKGWTETNPAILRTIAIESTSNNVVLGLIVVIASFGVVSTLNLSVISATGQIGMLRAMGATVSSIQRVFILQSGILGLLGALAGTFAGVLIALAIGQYEYPGRSIGSLRRYFLYPDCCPLQDILIHYFRCVSAESDYRSLSCTTGSETGPCKGYQFKVSAA